jgi:NTE family protein
LLPRQAIVFRIILSTLLLNGVFCLSAISQSKTIIRPTFVPKNSSSIWFRTSKPVHRPKVGVVLSGGGGRGLAQIGVLRVLESHNIPIDLIVGNSLGSVIGGLYASGYSTSEIESIATHTNWSELLSFTEETKRSDLFIGQKQTQQEGYFSIRFNGLEPIIPSSISGGQRLSNFLTYLSLQARYQPDSSFDDLKIPFRAIATDIISGKRVIIDHGSLAEAMRASITVPLLYSPLEKDSMFMVDGGLTSNIPVDVAKNLGCDVVIAVNSTSSMRGLDNLKAPWEVADQIMSIMMQESNKQQLKLADIVITPMTGERIVSDFSGIDSLISAGKLAAEQNIRTISTAINAHENISAHPPVLDTFKIIIDFEKGLIDENLKQEIYYDVKNNTLSQERIQEYINKFYGTGKYSEVYAELTDSANQRRVNFHQTPCVRIKEVLFNGNTLLSDDLIKIEMDSCRNKFINDPCVARAFENILSHYRRQGFSLARVESVNVDSVTGILKFKIYEGQIIDIQYVGNEKTRSYIIRREFPLEVGDVFDIDKALEGIVNIKSTGLFEYALLDVKYLSNEPIIILKVKEKSSELVRLGFHADDEHGIVSTIDARDVNFRGAWEDLGIVLRYGYRDRFVRTEYTVNRIFHSYFTFNLRGYFKSRDVLTYQPPSTSLERWDIIEAGKYRENKYGGTLTFGSHFKRFGDVTGEWRLENHQIKVLSGDSSISERYQLSSVKFQSTIDTEDKFSFPTKGVYLQVTFESASKRLASDIGFGKLSVVYENYFTFLPRHSIRPRITFGYADPTLPLDEHYSLGGLNSFYGLREDNNRGRQIFLINTEYRFWLPFKLIFETYLKLRYDLGTISLKREELKFNKFHHGFGISLALDTPLGATTFGLGKCFYFQQGLPNSPIAVGPLLFYFSIGPNL